MERFAEIGAGQEVARRFFRVGGAAGTIAKTMSAYDVTFSDAIYGPTDRHVSRIELIQAEISEDAVKSVRSQMEVFAHRRPDVYR